MVGTKGSDCQSLSGPVGTTSVWPAKQTSGRAVPRLAQRFVTSPNGMLSARNPALASRAAISCWQPPSCGVTDLRAISSRASSSAPELRAAASGIHVDLYVAERCAACGREDAFLLFFLLARGRRGGRRRDRRRLAGDLAGGGLVDQPQHVGRGIGVRHRFFLRDLAFDEHLEERLLEGLRAGRHALLERVLDLVDLAFLDQLGDVAGGWQTVP